MTDFDRSGYRHRSDNLVRFYVPSWGASNIDYDAPWSIRPDGSDATGCPAGRMRSAAFLAGWSQMRQIAPVDQWSVELCDAIVEATLRTVRDWVEAP